MRNAINTELEYAEYVYSDKVLWLFPRSDCVFEYFTELLNVFPGNSQGKIILYDFQEGEQVYNCEYSNYYTQHDLMVSQLHDFEDFLAQDGCLEIAIACHNNAVIRMSRPKLISITSGNLRRLQKFVDFFYEKDIPVVDQKIMKQEHFFNFSASQAHNEHVQQLVEAFQLRAS